MSKSLKNFISIREALSDYTSRQIRFCFLSYKYNASMDYTDSSMTQAIHTERIFVEFFHNVKAVIRRLGSGSTQYLAARDKALFKQYQSVRNQVHDAICDDFDTPRMLLVLQDLIRHVNRYIEDPPHVSSLLQDVARYVTHILHCVGIVTDLTGIGFPYSAPKPSSALEASKPSGIAGGEHGGDQGEEASADVGSGREEVLAPYLDALTKFRETIRVAAISGQTREILIAADDLRDNVLPELGVRMEDKGSGSQTVTIWKLESPEELRKEKARKEELKRANEAKREELLRKQREKEERAKVAPADMFKSQTDLYSQFDEMGVPTHDRLGEPLGKKVVKKLQKEMEKQVEVHAAYLESLTKL